MPVIYCCGGLRRCKQFELVPQDGYIKVTIHLLDECPQCGHAVAMLTRYDLNHDISFVRKTKEKALKLFERCKSSILYEQKRNVVPRSTFYLFYNEFGKKKRCYSNLSTMQMGLFEDGQEIPAPMDYVTPPKLAT